MKKIRRFTLTTRDMLSAARRRLAEHRELRPATTSEATEIARDPELGAVWWISRIEEVHSEPRYRIEIRMGSEWKPAVHGTWNQTILDDEEASSVHGEREAHELLQSLANAIDVTKYITRKVEILDEEEIHDHLNEVRATGRARVYRGGLYTMAEENSTECFCGAVNRAEAQALIEAHFMCFAAGALARGRK